jgi:hypothetical protein
MLICNIKIHQDESNQTSLVITRYNSAGAQISQTTISGASAAGAAILNAMAISYPPPPKPSTILRFSVDGDHWEPILAPCDCNYYVLYNTNALILRSDPLDQLSEMQCAANANPSLLMPPASPTTVRFRRGDSIVYAKSTAGTQTLVGVFVQ